MSQVSFVKDVAVISLAVSGSEDHSAKKGFLVKLASGKAALNDSATVPAFAVIMDGEKAGGQDSIGVLGGNLGTVKFKAGGAITQGSKLQQKNDGTVVVDAGNTTARVIVGEALEDAAQDELFEAIACNPRVLTVGTAIADATDATSAAALANDLKAKFNAFLAAQ